MKVMMLTAGEGTRLRPHTSKLPKPALSFLNVPLFLHALRFLEEVSPTEVIFNTFHLPEKLKSVVLEYANHFNCQFSDEKTLMGSGGGLGQARNFFEKEEDFILMNGDELILPERSLQLKDAVKYHRAQKNIATLMVTDHPEVGKKFGGVWVDNDDKVMGFGKQPVEKSKKGFHYIGAGIFSKRIFSYIANGESNILYDNLMTAIAAGNKASVYPISCHWYETGNENDFKSAAWECLLQIDKKNHQGIYLLETISRYNPECEFIKTEKALILAHKSSIIDFRQVNSFGIFDKNVTIANGIKLEKIICGRGVTINSDTSDKMIL